MKTHRSILRAFAATLVVAMLALWHQPADGQRLPSRLEYRDNLGTITSDTLGWLASGSVPGTGGVRVDTLINTAVDTSVPGKLFIGGASGVLVELLARPFGSDSVNVLYTFQVASSPDTTAMWHSLSATFNSAPADNTSDTLAVLLTSPLLEGLADTSAALALATAETGFRTVPLADRALVYGSRYLRVIARAQAESGDSMAVSGVATLRWPR